MNIQQLNPWNWFKHEQPHVGAGNEIPIARFGSELNSKENGRNMHPVLRLHNEIDRLFNDAFSGFNWPGLDDAHVSDWWRNMASTPEIDVAGDEKSYQVQLDVPGMEEKDLSVEVQGDSLLIKGNKRESQERKDKHFYRVERRYGEFQRVLALPEDADADNIKASLKQGVLNLEIPRKELPKPDVKKISIH